MPKSSGAKAISRTTGRTSSEPICQRLPEAIPGGNTHTHTRLTALFPGLPGWAGTRNVKPIWILLKQEIVSGSGISWAICKSAPRSRQNNHASTSPLSFLQAGYPSCRPTNSVKALKAQILATIKNKKINNKSNPERSTVLGSLSQTRASVPRGAQILLRESRNVVVIRR